MQHPERAVDGARLGFRELGGELVELNVAGMDESCYLTEGQEVILRSQTEDVEHRMRPENASAREVPIPQSAAPAIERGVDAAAYGVVDQIGFARAHGLPVEGKTEDEQHKSGGGGQRHGKR